MQFSSYTTQDSAQILKNLKTTSNGLSTDEVRRRQKKYGLNQLALHQVKWWQILGRQFSSPFIYLLLFAVVLSFVLREFTDAWIILTFITINTGLAFFQEFHSENSLKALEHYIEPEARVIRNKKEITIQSSDLVPGDVVTIEAGDLVPADVRFLSTENIIVDESVLTGESTSITKIEKRLSEEAQELYKAVNIGFSGTRVVVGKATGVVIATGKNTVIGDISRLTVETKQKSAFEQSLFKFSRFILQMIILIIIVLFLVNIAIKGRSANIPELVLFCIALAVGVVPEALPIVTTIAFSRGALRLAKHQVVVKRLSAIEDLGSIQILCTDKTGTLTENSLAVAEVHAADKKRCIFLNAIPSTSFEENYHDVNNSFDQALLKTMSTSEKNKLKKIKKLSDLPFDPQRKRNSALVEWEGSLKLIVRGAPEVILKLCKKNTLSSQHELTNWLKEQGAMGRRVIAVATKSMTHHTYSMADEKELEFQGMVSFTDPIKKSTPLAIKRAKDLGIEMKILTGDSKEVAGAVAYKIGLTKNPTDVVSGEELEKKSTEAQHEMVMKSHVFARVSPEQKYLIIKLLRERKEVGYLGEGINDGPALKMAHVGIVVKGAASIAREAADIVLLQNSLAVIIEGIKEGREIFSNVIKYIKLTLISNFGNFYAIATAAIILPYLPMLPIQILLLNLLSDFPMLTISIDTVEERELRRPRSYNIREVILISIILGIISTMFDFIFFAAFRKSPPEVLQTCWFVGSVLTELVLIFSVRTRGFFLSAKMPHWLLIIASVVAAGLTIIIPYTGWGVELFKFAAPSWKYIRLVGVIVGGYFIVTEGVKLLYYKFFNQEQKTAVM